MAKLTDTQLMILSKAAARDDGAAIFPETMNKAAKAKVGASLVARKLMREIKSKPYMPVWRTEDKGRSFSLTITPAGRDAIGIVEIPRKGEAAAPPAKAQAIKSESRECKPNAFAEPAPQPRGEPTESPTNAAPRANSKQALVIGLLSRSAGANLETLVAATGWLPHTTRAALTGLRKRGFAIERHRHEGARAWVYRIIVAVSAAA